MARVGLQVARDARRYLASLGGLWRAARDGAGPNAAPAAAAPWLADRHERRGSVSEEHGELAELAEQFVLFLIDGDVLEPDARLRIAACAWDDPKVDLVIFDDDVLDERGFRDPRFHASWSPEAMLGANDVGRAFAVRREVLDGCGGPPRAELADARWWDLLLRLDPEPSRVARIPAVLLHQRRRPDPEAEQALAVVREHLARTGRAAELTWEPTATGSGTVRVHWSVDPAPHATVIVPTRHDRRLLEACLASLATTDYPAFDVVVVDNGPDDGTNASWYDAQREATGLDLTVLPWSAPFNFSAVNNAAVARARGDVLVFLNDDTVVLAADWLRELAGWALQPEVGVVGTHLLAPDGTLQHAGVVVGMNGFADHVLAGLPPDCDTLFGPTRRYRNHLAVTAACCAVRRTVFDAIGGFDERFVLCGSDVALGLAAVRSGLRNVCTPFACVRHEESATRGSPIPESDFHASWWAYQRWLRGGDPSYSPNLSLQSRIPAPRRDDEPSPLARVGEVLARPLEPGSAGWDDEEHASWLARRCNAGDEVVAAVRALHASNAAPFDPRTINWWMPDLDSPFYGGINTALRLADHLAREHGVQNHFVVAADANEPYFRSAFAAAFPSLAGSPITFVDDPAHVDRAPEADVSIATLWETAYLLARAPGTKRKMYLVQDDERVFYPAGTKAALAGESYRLGLYAICNTERVFDVYREELGGDTVSATWFAPAVDPAIFHPPAPDDRGIRNGEEPVTVFVYARPGHPRNCWELASAALADLKARLGSRVRIVTAGSWATPGDVGSGICHLGMLDYADTGALYRSCDLALTLQVSEHPSYLPLELLACGVPVVAFDNPAGDWLLEHEVTALRCRPGVDSLAAALERLATDADLRARLGAAGAALVASRHASWEKAFAPIWPFLCDPEGARAP